MILISDTHTDVIFAPILAEVYFLLTILSNMFLFLSLYESVYNVIQIRLSDAIIYNQECRASLVLVIHIFSLCKILEIKFTRLFAKSPILFPEGIAGTRGRRRGVARDANVGLG